MPSDHAVCQELRLSLFYENTLFSIDQRVEAIGSGVGVAGLLLLCLPSQANQEKSRTGYVLNPIAEVRGHRPGVETCQGEMVRLVLVLTHVTLGSSAAGGYGGVGLGLGGTVRRLPSLLSSCCRTRKPRSLLCLQCLQSRLLF